jgi:hypothetical protein
MPEMVVMVVTPVRPGMVVRGLPVMARPVMVARGVLAVIRVRSVLVAQVARLVVWVARWGWLVRPGCR